MTLSSARQLVIVVLFAALASGCASTQDLDTVRPSFLLRAAYITNVVPTVRISLTTWNRELPARQTEIDPAKDGNVVFIMVFSSPEALSLRANLKSPDGAVRDTLNRRLDRYTTSAHTSPDFWRYSHWTLWTGAMQKNPGLWSLDFFLNDIPMGTYRFWLGDPPTVARLKKQGATIASVIPEGYSALRTDRAEPRQEPLGPGDQIDLIRINAESGNGQAMAMLGFMYFTGSNGVTKDDVTAVRWFRKGADTGNGLAMAFLGASYWMGLGELPKDTPEAVQWYRKGSAAGSGRAMALLGQTYLSGGGGLAMDEGEAVTWFSRGAKAGDGRAMALLGQIYLTGGGGLARDEAEAVRWMRKAADSGDGLAMAMLGSLYETADGGVAKDDAEAVRWYRKGVQAGSGRAMAQLGRMYADGRGGLAKSPADAVRWFRAGANLADALSMFELARAYETGDGVSKDRQQAIQWYRKSAALGHPDAVDRLQTVAQ